MHRGMATKKPIIAVVGATGMQGGGLVDAILEDGTFACRAITRNPSSEKGKALASRGCEVVDADLSKPDSLKKAFSGAHGAFIITNYWEINDDEKEFQQAVTAADAAVEAGVKHIVFSTLEDVVGQDSLLNLIPKIGNLKVPHFDAKGRATHYMKAKGYPVTFLFTSFYMENFYFFGMMSRKDDTHYETVLPTLRGTKIPMVSTRDIGLAALQIFKSPQEYIHQDFKVIGELVSPRDIALKLSKATGVEVVSREPPPLEFAEAGFPGARDLGHMFLFMSEYQDLWKTYVNVKGHEDFDTFLHRNGKALKDFVHKTNAAAVK